MKRSRGDHVAGSVEDEKELIEDEAANSTIAFLPASVLENFEDGPALAHCNQLQGVDLIARVLLTGRYAGVDRSAAQCCRRQILAGACGR